MLPMWLVVTIVMQVFDFLKRTINFKILNIIRTIDVCTSLSNIYLFKKISLGSFKFKFPFYFGFVKRPTGWDDTILFHKLGV
jgi:hypothetical protein